MDDSGRMSETSKDEMKFTLPEGANESNAMLQYKTNLETRGGNHRIDHSAALTPRRLPL